jgi:hypothetical protein
MKPDDRVRLRHIADALNAAIRFTEGRSREDLDKAIRRRWKAEEKVRIVAEIFEEGANISEVARRPRNETQSAIRRRLVVWA